MSKAQEPPIIVVLPKKLDPNMAAVVSGSSGVYCHICGEDCWISPNGYKFWEDSDFKHRIICGPCVAGLPGFVDDSEIGTIPGDDVGKGLAARVRRIAKHRRMSPAKMLRAQFEQQRDRMQDG